MNVMRAADLPRYYNAVDILERNLAERADKIALCSPERNMTFREVSQEANRVGNALKRLHVRVGDVVGILCPDQAEWVTTFFGAMKIGAVALGINTLLTPREFAYILEDSRTRVLIVHESLYPKIEAFRKECRFLEHVVVVGDGEHSYEEWIRNEPAELAAASTQRDDFATLNYSSGTTGEPKGIFHAHKDLPLTAQLFGVNVLGLRSEDRTFAASKLFFTFGTGGNLLFPWYAGAGIVLFAGPPRISTNVLEMAERFKPTILFNAPTGYAVILAIEDFMGKYDLSSVRLCVSAGEALPAPIWRRWKETTGLDIIDGIGSTENYHTFISNRPGDIRPGSSGKVVPGYEVKIVDEDFCELPPGQMGNLLVKGETAALFYLHDYERSQKTFLGEWLFTGDKYYVDTDGYYWHAG
ncbi:MAG TPA: benzoate-CoA ligase family protein, partial [bacterium]|nr:benzoate-CoA ligase family protein [bacterium]